MCSSCRLSKLKILEIRENHLKTLPKSFSRLVELEKLDIGHNEFTELVGRMDEKMLLFYLFYFLNNMLPLDMQL